MNVEETRRPRGEPWILLVALALPTALAWGYFVVGGSWLGALYPAAKAAQFVLPLVWLAYADRSRLIREQGFLPSKGGIVIEDDVWIGANCVLLDGAVLRRGCVVGAGSIVRGELLAYTVYAGQPLAAVGERR